MARPGSREQAARACRAPQGGLGRLSAIQITCEAAWETTETAHRGTESTPARAFTGILAPVNLAGFVEACPAPPATVEHEFEATSIPPYPPSLSKSPGAGQGAAGAPGLADHMPLGCSTLLRALCLLLAGASALAGTLLEHSPLLTTVPGTYNGSTALAPLEGGGEQQQAAHAPAAVRAATSFCVAQRRSLGEKGASLTWLCKSDLARVQCSHDCNPHCIHLQATPSG